MNQKNSLGLDKCFLDTNDPIELFKTWFNEAKKTEPNDPNALSLATSNKKGMQHHNCSSKNTAVITEHTP